MPSWEWHRGTVGAESILRGVEIDGKVAIVTGAGIGIGRAIAGRLAREGAAVLIVDLEQDAGREAAAAIEDAGGHAAFFKADVAVEADVAAMIGVAERELGGLDVLVNNVGGFDQPIFPDAPSEHWRRPIDAILLGTMYGIQRALEPMRRRGGGVIVNVASSAGLGFAPYANAPEYAAAKAAVIRLTAVLDRLKDEANVRVNCICPDWVATERVRDYLSELSEDEQAALPVPPPAVLVEPDDLAQGVVDFVADESLAGRIMVFWGGEPPHLLPNDRRE